MIFVFSAEVESWIKSERIDGNLACDGCAYRTKKIVDMRRHIEAKHLYREYPCPYCERIFRTKKSRYTHSLLKHNIKC